MDQVKHFKHLGPGDIEILNLAREANPQWMEAIMLAAEIMAERRRKWSGQSNPYANFIKLAQAEQSTVERAFHWVESLKMTRDNDSEAADDSQQDNSIDKTNYTALEAGWRLMTPVQKIVAMLDVGIWIDSRLLESWTLIAEE